MGNILKYKEGDYILLPPVHHYRGVIGRIIRVEKVGHGSEFETQYGKDTIIDKVYIKTKEGLIEYYYNYQYRKYKLLTEEEYFLEAL
jgi:hypothetical protein